MRRTSPLPGLLSVTLLLASLAACATDVTSLGEGGSAPAVDPGLPCDVAAVLASRCVACHSDPPQSAAPQPLVTRADLLAASEEFPSETNAERAVARMREGTMPAGGGAEADAEVLQAWLDAGAPAGTCDGVVDPFATPSSCESGRTWVGEEGPDMNPGQACNRCHAQELAEGEEEARIFLAAGTVYPNGHAPDRCWGVDGGAAAYANLRVVLADANQATYELDVRATGNFFLEEAEGFTPPYTAKVVDLGTGEERVMVGPQTDGDCNACHTEAGGGEGSTAPGRILVP